jgi:crooked neck
VFADDEREANPTSFKFLQMAHAWKTAQQGLKSGGAGLSIQTNPPASGSRDDDDMGEDQDDAEDDKDSVASSN